MAGLKSIQVFGIIHLFALLHAAVALLCRFAGIQDELALTMLTIVMIVLVCLDCGLNVEFTAASVIFVNVIGYLLGTGGAEAMELIINSSFAVHAVATFLTTEILGWSIVWFSRFFRSGDDPAAAAWTPRIGLLLTAVAVIFAGRLAYVQLFSLPSFHAERIYRLVDMLLSNSAALIVLLCATVIQIRYVRRNPKGRDSFQKAAASLAFILGASACLALAAGLHLPFGINRSFTWREFLQLSSISLLVELTLYSIVFMIDYAWVARNVLRTEREKAHQAQFLYMRLKQQVNPHFLFNSLNILDCLVCEQKTEQASAYIHKLAGVYRYLLRNEDDPIVSLREEMRFVEMYADLLQVRFTDGFRIETDIEEEAFGRNIVPCSVQLLIENAIKHNVVEASDPLIIRIVARKEEISVSNNLRPKVSGVPSTHVGLNYIRQQYLDLANIPIGISRTEKDYRVTLPLL